jgi:sigma-54 dependent transcriptional regulator of gfr operon
MKDLKDKIYDYIVDHCRNLDSWQLNTAAAVSVYFNVSRNIVSQYLNEFVKDGTFGKINSRPVIFFVLPKKSPDMLIFSSITEAQKWLTNTHSIGLDSVIGSQGSLKGILAQMKAAIQYPPYGLPILLHGETGTGKSFLANAVYEHLVVNSTISEDKKFVAVNCSEYANNPELFLSNFFGHVKGAYTGASENRRGLAELAAGGILFLDEVHSLSNECQEKLFQFMDLGKFHRLGDNEKWYESRCRIIFATSELPEKHLLTTLQRRIPVKITLPTLENRSNFERKQLIQMFFKEEEARISKKIYVSGQLYELLMTYSFEDNLGNLKNIIQISCANAFSVANDNTEGLQIQMSALPSTFDFREYKIHHHEKQTIYIGVNELIRIDEKISFVELLLLLINIWGNTKDDKSLFQSYDKELKKRFLNSQREKQNNYSSYAEIRFRQFIKHLEKNFQIQFDYFYFHLGIMFLNSWMFQYMNTTIDLEKWENFEKDLTKSVRQELLWVHDFTRNADIDLSEEHYLVLAILFHLMTNRDYSKNRLALIIAHGDTTASSLASTANRMMGRYIFDSIDMPLNTSSKELATKINHYLQERKHFEELILLVDMGSLEKIHEHLEIPKDRSFGILNNVSTRMAIDVANQLFLNIPLKNILEQAQVNQTVEYRYQPSNRKKEMIICSCASGLGTSFKLKQILESSLPKTADFLIETSDFYSLVNENYLEELKKDYQILFIVGTLNPNIEGMAFYSIEELILGINIEDLSNKLTKHFKTEELDLLNENILKNFSLTNLMEQLTILNPSKLLEQVSDAIYILQNELGLRLDNNTCFGLYVHISCLIERLVTQPHLQDEIYVDLKDKHLRIFHQKFKKSFTVVEQYYSVEIPAFEVNYIYDYTKKA